MSHPAAFSRRSWRQTSTASHSQTRIPRRTSQTMSLGPRLRARPWIWFSGRRRGWRTCPTHPTPLPRVATSVTQRTPCMTSLSWEICSTPPRWVVRFYLATEGVARSTQRRKEPLHKHRSTKATLGIVSYVVLCGAEIIAPCEHFRPWEGGWTKQVFLAKKLNFSGAMFFQGSRMSDVRGCDVMTSDVTHATHRPAKVLRTPRTLSLLSSLWRIAKARSASCCYAVPVSRTIRFAWYIRVGWVFDLHESSFSTPGCCCRERLRDDQQWRGRRRRTSDDHRLFRPGDCWRKQGP